LMAASPVLPLLRPRLLLLRVALLCGTLSTAMKLPPLSVPEYLLPDLPPLPSFTPPPFPSFSPPRPLFKPMATGLVWVGSTFPQTLPMTHAAMDWLLSEHAAATRPQDRPSPPPPLPATRAATAAPPAREPPPASRGTLRRLPAPLFALLASRAHLALLRLRRKLRALRLAVRDALLAAVRGVIGPAARLRAAASGRKRNKPSPADAVVRPA